MDQSVQDFYGEAIARVRNPDKAASAVKQFNIAMRAMGDGVRAKALEMAAKSELEAFAA